LLDLIYIMPHQHQHQHHDGHIPVHVHLSKAQISKAKNGHPIQLAHHQINVHGHQIIHSHPENYKKLLHSHHHKKGCRLHLTHHEMAHGKGFFDFLKTIASPVLSGLQGVAKELFPGSAATIDGIRNGIRTATGYGLKPKKTMFAHAGGPEHFPAQHAGEGIKKTHKKRGKRGFGIQPSGFY